MQFVKIAFLNFWRVIVWGTFIFVLCLQRVDRLPKSSFFSQIPHFDKLFHFGLYFCFMVLLLSAFFRQKGMLTKKTYIVCFLFTFSCGVLIEFLQNFSGRSCDFYDVLANTAGIVLASFLYVPIKKWLGNII